MLLDAIVCDRWRLAEPFRSSQALASRVSPWYDSNLGKTMEVPDTVETWVHSQISGFDFLHPLSRSDRLMFNQT